MAFTAGGGITINGNITLTTSGPAFSYNAGNSMSYSGSGTNNKVYDLPLSSNIIFDFEIFYFFEVGFERERKTCFFFWCSFGFYVFKHSCYNVDIIQIWEISFCA